MIQKKSITFGDLGLSVDLQKALKDRNLITPTPIQEKCISLGLDGKDIVGIAQTGTGKTLAFGLPALEQILKGDGKALIVLPTRELAIQVEDVLADLGKPFKIRTALLIGGISSYPQKLELRRDPEIIVATPGRLIDHIKQRNCNLKDINIVVLDEADRMLDIGFMPQIREILKSIPSKRQTMLFSATMPREVADLSVQYMNHPTKIEVSPSGTSAINIEQEAYIVHSKEKSKLLRRIISENDGSILVFSRTKFKAKKVASFLRELRFTAIEMHSDRSLAQRRNALAGFKDNRFKILVATDVAARGLDVDDISLVINMDLPDCTEDYVHRIGRTGRAGKKGKAISFVEPNERFKLKNIQRLIKKEIPIVNKAEVDFEKENTYSKNSPPKRKWDNNKSKPRKFNRSNSSKSKPGQKRSRNHY